MKLPMKLPMQPRRPSAAEKEDNSGWPYDRAQQRDLVRRARAESPRDASALASARSNDSVPCSARSAASSGGRFRWEQESDVSATSSYRASVMEMVKMQGEDEAS